MQKLVERVKLIILKPREAWEKIGAEEGSEIQLYKEYLLLLAAIPALALFLGRWIVGIRIPFFGIHRLSLGASLFNSVISYILTVAGVWVLGKVISLLATNFGGARDDFKGSKLAVYSYTPFFIAGILYLIPSLGALVFIAGLYGLYLLYLGLPIVMATPKEKSMAYTIVIIVSVILIYIIVASITAAILGAFGPDFTNFG